jgi:isopentenyl-diphosphate delta-isomerase
MVHVVLVDQDDNEVGIMEKMEAHQKGVLHRAFSVLLFNSKHELLLQKRADQKYHSGGLWTNTCCSHPLPGEAIEDATHRSLLHEMGIEVRAHFLYKFLYEADLDGDLKEHELDYVFIGVYDGEPVINCEEVSDWKFIDTKSLQKDMTENPSVYSCWFKIMMQDPAMERFL